MSLVGNLEDLSLGDILQIISLSQKSGVLTLASDHGSGRIVFRRGLVEAARLKGAPNSMRELLIGGGHIDPAGYDAAESRCQQQSVSIEQALAAEVGLTPERIEGLVREAAEAAILEMFVWPAGDFSFDLRSELDPEDPQLILTNGLNAQYLAMEGLRLRDERSRDAGGAAAEARGGEGEDKGEEAARDSLFGSDPLETDGVFADADDLLVDSFELIDDGVEPASLAADLVDERASSPAPAQAARENEASELLVARAIERTEQQAEGPDAGQMAASVATTIASAGKRPVVLIDPNVVVLEWAKAAIEDTFARVHVFQQAEQGLSRIRQYLIRSEIPLVVISTETPIDPLSGIHGLSDFVKRLKTQAPRLVVIGLAEADAEGPVSIPSGLDAVVRRPARRILADPTQPAARSGAEALARALQGSLVEEKSVAPIAAPIPVARESDAVDALDEVIRSLEAATSRGEVLPLVLDFAAGLFARAAILIVRGDEVFANAGRGIPALECDPLDSSPPDSLSVVEPGWVRQVIESGEACTGPPQTAADHALLDLFGGEVPSLAYLAPVESGSSVIALLYADQGHADLEPGAVGEGAAPLPKTDELERVLQRAGLALDRAALERALWEVDAEGR